MGDGGNHRPSGLQLVEAGGCFVGGKSFVFADRGDHQHVGAFLIMRGVEVVGGMLFELDYIPLPDIKDVSGIDAEAIRQSLREGRAGPTAAQYADQYSDEQVMQVYARDRYMTLDHAGRLDEDGNILPEQQGQ